VKKLKEATVDDIRNSGVPQNIAEKIYETLQK
jgi:excinuclease ABC subunit C